MIEFRVVVVVLGDVCRNVASVFDLFSSSEPPWFTVLAFRVIVGARGLEGAAFGSFDMRASGFTHSTSV